MARFGHIFRWDLDKTYLKTEFNTLRDLVRTARLTAEERENVPGSAALIRAMSEVVPESERNLVFFVSGSPEQLRTVIEKKFALDGFVPDGFVLKPTVQNILRGRFRAVRGQVGYKLHQLLLGRAEVPIGSKETLFGDDAESDAFIYSLYADVVAGKIRGDELSKVLKTTGCYAAQIRDIEEALEAIVHEDPVKRIIIHLDQHTPPIAFLPFFPRVVPIYNHLQTAIVMVLDGTLGTPVIHNVGRELIGRYGYDVQRLTNLAEDILRRRRVYQGLPRLERLANDLRMMKPPALADAKAERELDEKAVELIGNIAERADYLRSRPLPDEPVPEKPRSDYLGLWTEEKERHEEVKRAKKAAAQAGKR